MISVKDEKEQRIHEVQETKPSILVSKGQEEKPKREVAVAAVH